ncbi:MAG: YkgJ family cysteine cluster protein [Candidatus Bathyarchaeota archaeon]|nr:YkgJ family cysteine cluster protein [Candidatus Bathyarchaeota archaeon]
MKEDSESKEHPLNSGTPCVKHGCTLCCIETRMPLSHLDIDRILKLDYPLEHFASKTDEGYRLKNQSGRCIFLTEDKCKIYAHRPEGCRLYPLVYDMNTRKAVLDELCPYHYEYEVRKVDAQKLSNLLKKLEREKSRHSSTK